MIDCKKYGFKDCDSEEKTRGEEPILIENYPEPKRKFKLVYQSFNQSVEEIYFWIVSSLRDDFGFHDVKKITDVFTASEQSAFWGQAQQRLTIQQGQVSNYLATIGKLTKELFQIVRELKIHDERLELYEMTYKAIERISSVNDRKTSHAAETVLKGYWVDMKDGGVKSPGSVYGLSSTLGYTALPDLFFAAPPMKKNEVDAYIDKTIAKSFNVKLRDVLGRKLQAYCMWKDHTHLELKNRHTFMLKFLRQHYNAIQMYIDWIKPYLKNTKRLSQSMTRVDSEDLISAFEGSFTEIEVVFKRPVKSCYAVVVLNILFRTQPHMDFHQEGYQHKGPVHVGRSEIVMRGYSWTSEQFSKYVEMRGAETLDMLGDIDSSLKESIDALGDELRNYLKKAGEKFPEDVKKEADEKKAAEKRLKQMSSAAEPFMAVFSGFKEIFSSFIPDIRSKGKEKQSDWVMKKEEEAAVNAMQAALWNTYKNFKKAHKMTTW